MDRRQVLVGMTAMGVAGSLNLSELLSAQSGVFERTTTIFYNEQEDKAREHQTFTDNTAGPEHLPHLPSDSDTRWTYQYEQL